MSAWVTLGLLSLGCSGTPTATGSGATGTGGTEGTIPIPTVPAACTEPAVAADVSKPTTVVGSGSGTCNEAALDTALTAGGIITFNCGASDTTITVTSSKQITKDTVIDGGKQVTISGGGTQRIFVVNGAINFTVQNITLADAFLNAARGNGPSSANSGAAIYRQSESTLQVIGTTFNNNHATDRTFG